MDLLNVPPSPALIGLRPKSRWHPSAHDDVIVSAIGTARGVLDVIPVFAETGHVIGLVQGEPHRRRVRFKPITHQRWCGFTSYNDLLAEVTAGKFYEAVFRKDQSGTVIQNRWLDVWPCNGIPGPGDYSGTADTARQFDNTTTGCLYLPAAGGGETRHLVGFTCSQGNNTNANVQGLFYDRVLAYDGAIISTGSRNMTNGVTAQRYISAGESGLSIMVTCQALTGATNSNLTTLTYVDQDGNTGITVPTTDALPWCTSADTPTGTIPSGVIVPHDPTAGITWGPFLPLAAGDTGVRSITNYQSSANNTGTASFVLVKALGTFFSRGSTVQRVDLSQTMFGLERLYAGACLNMVINRTFGAAISSELTIRMAYG